jgi:hypothetical protein
MPKKTTPKDISSPFKLPEEMNFSRERQPRSVRFNPETEAYLEKEAERANVGFATLISKLADDYSTWLKRQRGDG